ncbi:delta-60 repeat domain-containing protein [Flavobacterium sp.]
MRIAGSFTSFSGTSQNRIARLNINGTLDITSVS